MGFEGFIARKHLTHRRKTGFISLISFISIAGVGIGVMALIVVLAVMSGFDRELKSKIINVQPHIRIEKFGGIASLEDEIAKIKTEKLPGLLNASGFVEGQAIIRSQESATGVIVKGLDTAREDLAVYAGHMAGGALDFSDTLVRQKKKKLFKTRTVEKHYGGILIGEELARKLRVGRGDHVTLIAPFQDPGNPFSLMKAHTQLFIVKGVFRLGMNDFDSGLVLISLPQAQELYHLGAHVSGISLRFQNVDEAERVKFQLRSSFGLEYVIRSWYDMNHNFFQALKVEKSVMTILLALIILVAAFNIVSTLMMVVMEKTKDIGILRAIGATRGSIRRIFVIEGFSIGIWGVAMGAAAGLLLAFNLNPVSDFIKDTTGLEVFPSDIYFFDKIPAEVHGEDVATIVIFAMIAAVMAGFYPAHRASQLNPIEALRYE